MKRFLPIVVVLAVAASANAVTLELSVVFQGQVVTTDAANPGTYNVYDLMCNTDPDWTNTVMNLTLTSGEFYQHYAGLDTEPPAFMVGLFPELAYDTYAAVPTGDPEIAAFTAGRVIDTTNFKASWFDSDDDGAGNYRIARMSVTTNAEGDTGSDLEPFNNLNKVYNTDPLYSGIGLRFRVEVEAGEITVSVIPEPATMGLLVLGGLGVLVRKRR